MELTVVIVSYNARAELEKCLAALFSRTHLDSLEVVVADNASDDGSREMLAELFAARIRLIPCEANLGFGRASNLGWRQAKSSLVLFLNPDAIVGERALDRMVSVLHQRPEVGVVGPLLRYEDGAVQMSAGQMMSLAAEIGQKAWNRGYARGRGPLKKAVERMYSRERFVDWVSGACLMTRRDLLETTGGFDETFFLYAEDVDLCARIRATGARVLFTPRAEVVHLVGRSVAKDRSRAIFEAQRSRLYFYDKHHGGLQAALLRVYLAMKSVVAFLLWPRDRDAHRNVLRLILSGVDR
ncbi:MAG TPA: glycosyltransferase family 2 protein [Vicinamibacteria bacterium]|nr:glycosyltransferase family 2 protein [Vicinamibacteria bacterium]